MSKYITGTQSKVLLPLTQPNPGAVISLFAAVTEGNIGDVKEALLTNGVMPDIRDKESGESLVHAAINGRSANKLSLVKYLVTNGAPAMSFDNNSVTPLHLAAKQKDHPLIDYLINECNCDPNVRDNQGLTPLHLAVSVIGGECLIRQETKKIKDSLMANIADRINNSSYLTDLSDALFRLKENFAIEIQEKKDNTINEYKLVMSSTNTTKDIEVPRLIEDLSKSIQLLLESKISIMNTNDSLVIKDGQLEEINTVSSVHDTQTIKRRVMAITTSDLAFLTDSLFASVGHGHRHIRDLIDTNTALNTGNRIGFTTDELYWLLESTPIDTHLPDLISRGVGNVNEDNFYFDYRQMDGDLFVKQGIDEYYSRVEDGILNPECNERIPYDNNVHNMVLDIDYREDFVPFVSKLEFFCSRIVDHTQVITNNLDLIKDYIRNGYTYFIVTCLVPLIQCDILNIVQYILAFDIERERIISKIETATNRLNLVQAQNEDPQTRDDYTYLCLINRMQGILSSMHREIKSHDMKEIYNALVHINLDPIIDLVNKESGLKFIESVNNKDSLLGSWNRRVTTVSKLPSSLYDYKLFILNNLGINTNSLIDIHTVIDEMSRKIPRHGADKPIAFDDTMSKWKNTFKTKLIDSMSNLVSKEIVDEIDVIFNQGFNEFILRDELKMFTRQCVTRDFNSKLMDALSLNNGVGLRKLVNCIFSVYIEGFNIDINNRLFMQAINDRNEIYNVFRVFSNVIQKELMNVLNIDNNRLEVTNTLNINDWPHYLSEKLYKFINDDAFNKLKDYVGSIDTNNWQVLKDNIIETINQTKWENKSRRVYDVSITENEIIQLFNDYMHSIKEEIVILLNDFVSKNNANINKVKKLITETYLQKIDNTSFSTFIQTNLDIETRYAQRVKPNGDIEYLTLEKTNRVIVPKSGFLCCYRNSDLVFKGLDSNYSISSTGVKLLNNDGKEAGIYGLLLDTSSEGTIIGINEYVSDYVSRLKTIAIRQIYNDTPSKTIEDTSREIDETGDPLLMLVLRVINTLVTQFCKKEINRLSKMVSNSVFSNNYDPGVMSKVTQTMDTISLNESPESPDLTNELLTYNYGPVCSETTNETVQVLINNGASPNKLDNNGMSVLTYAALNPDKETIKILLKTARNKKETISHIRKIYSNTVDELLSPPICENTLKADYESKTHLQQLLLMVNSMIYFDLDSYVRLWSFEEQEELLNLIDINKLSSNNNVLDTVIYDTNLMDSLDRQTNEIESLKERYKSLTKAINKYYGPKKDHLTNERESIVKKLNSYSVNDFPKTLETKIVNRVSSIRIDTLNALRQSDTNEYFEYLCETIHAATSTIQDGYLKTWEKYSSAPDTRDSIHSVLTRLSLIRESTNIVHKAFSKVIIPFIQGYFQLQHIDTQKQKIKNLIVTILRFSTSHYLIDEINKTLDGVSIPESAKKYILVECPVLIVDNVFDSISDTNINVTINSMIKTLPSLTQEQEQTINVICENTLTKAINEVRLLMTSINKYFGLIVNQWDLLGSIVALS